MTTVAQDDHEATAGDGRLASPDGGASGASAWLFTGAVLLSALLVFLVEPLLGRLLLPVLGGSPAVWNTSLAFFQAALLVGYAYAHLLQSLTSFRSQVVVHAVVLIAAGALLPLHVTRLMGEPSLSQPALWLLGVLTLTVGAPFAALSATAPLVQAWCARLDVRPPRGRDVYGLYAASNLGSLAALVAYPSIIEPHLGLRFQSQAWSVGYGLFILLLIVAALTVWRRSSAISPSATKPVGEPIAAAITPALSARSRWVQRLVWVALAAAPSSLLLGVTAHISSDVASAPFLWVAPLILYLLTFIIAFAQPRPSSSTVLWVHLVLVGVTLFALAAASPPWLFSLLVNLLTFFTTALVCHQALVARRPEPARLTEFYLLISVGGMIGGMFNALVAPVIFNQVWEYPIVLALTMLARPVTGARMGARALTLMVLGLMLTLPLWLPKLELPQTVAVYLLISPVVIAVLLHRQRRALTIVLLSLAVGAQTQNASRYVASWRSFFGELHVREMKDQDLGPIRMLVHGTTLHGVESLTRALSCRAGSYYARPTGIGQVFTVEQGRRPALSIGVIGLGAGTTASYVRPGDRVRYFEIDPLVAQVARDPRWFRYLSDCAKGPVDFVFGDARLKLHEQPLDAFDLLLVDAFSSDSVPTHLLTTEALRDYLAHIRPDGVVILHLSNRNMDLVPSAAASARAAGGAVLFGSYDTPKGSSPYAQSSSRVVILAHSEQVLDRYRNRPGWSAAPAGARAWTDDYVNVLGTVFLRLKELRAEARH